MPSAAQSYEDAARLAALASRAFASAARRLAWVSGLAGLRVEAGFALLPVDGRRPVAEAPVAPRARRAPLAGDASARSTRRKMEAMPRAAPSPVRPTVFASNMRNCW